MTSEDIGQGTDSENIFSSYSAVLLLVLRLCLYHTCVFSSPHLCLYSARFQTIQYSTSTKSTPLDAPAGGRSYVQDYEDTLDGLEFYQCCAPSVITPRALECWASHRRHSWHCSLRCYRSSSRSRSSNSNAASRKLHTTRCTAAGSRRKRFKEK